MCCRYKCQRAAAALRQARTICGADDAAVPTFIFKIEAVLGMSFCDPSSSLQRSGAISWLLPTRPFATSRAASSEWTGMTMAIPTHGLNMNCGKSQLNSALPKHRQAEQQQMWQLPSLRRAWSRRRS